MSNIRSDFETADIRKKYLNRIASKFRQAEDVVVAGNCATVDRNRDVNIDVYKNVEKFIKKEDQFLALGSLLLKSILCREVIHHIPPGIFVSLPRTQHGKPYVPKKIPEDLSCDISISHHFPFVGGCRFLGEARDGRLGLDIVTFDVFNDRVCDTYEDFVHIYQESFTSEEYQQICVLSGKERINEFCLRWAAKEAYTKALGVGLGFDFGSFGISFYASRDETNLWDLLFTKKDRFSLYGEIRKKGEQNSEVWIFTFLPLLEFDAIQGVACMGVCFPWFTSKTELETIGLKIKWMSLDDIVAEHG